MALAPFFKRSAVAIGHVNQGLDQDALAERLESVTVGVVAQEPDNDTSEAKILLGMTVELLARLYPRVSLVTGSRMADELAAIARGINPDIELTESRPDVTIVVGGTNANFPNQIYASSLGWTAAVSTDALPAPGDTDNPFGAAVAACLACSNVFRAVLLPDGGAAPDDRLEFSVRTMSKSSDDEVLEPVVLSEDDVLVGAGAIGSSAAWILARAPISGRMTVIDPEYLDLGNLQRYVGTSIDDVGEPKVELAARGLRSSLVPISQLTDWAGLVSEHGHNWDRVLVAVDTARSRRDIQSSLPRWIANAWTQPGDLGVSTHPQFGRGACLRCLYIPEDELPSEDELVASALGLDVDKRGLLLRQLLHSGAPPPGDLLDEVAANRGIDRESLVPYESQTIRNLYVEGICGADVVSIERVGVPHQEVHVPLAHQSALAGLLLASTLFKADQRGSEMSSLAHLDVLVPVPDQTVLPAQKEPRGRCICHDADYLRAYESKYPA